MKEFIERCLRILHIARKPSRRELDEIMRIAGLGILVVGFTGLVLYVIFSII
ncbi:MAG: protein translocase SEC61 complex subunit gamma [Candidatus Micrarchaeota archaeon]